MTKKNWYFLVMVFVLALVAVGFIMNVPIIKKGVDRIFIFAMKPEIFVPSAIFTFIFIDNKRFWLFMLGLAVITALVIQYGIIGKSGSLFTISMRATAFLLIAYLLSFAKLIFGKK